MSKELVVAAWFAVAGLVAACGGGAPTTSGGPAVSLQPLPSINIPTITLPSFEPDAELEAMFPTSVNGQPLQITSAKGEEVFPAFGSSAPERIRSVIFDLGASMDQVSAAIATGDELTGLTLIAFRVQGVPAANTLAALTHLTTEDVENAQVGTATIGGKQVTAITSPENATENAYLYAVGDVVFLGGGTPDFVDEAFAQLP